MLTFADIPSALKLFKTCHFLEQNARQCADIDSSFSQLRPFGCGRQSAAHVAVSSFNTSAAYLLPLSSNNGRLRRLHVRVDIVLNHHQQRSCGARGLPGPLLPTLKRSNADAAQGRECGLATATRRSDGGHINVPRWRRN
jgi:hypothetical protein